VGGKNPVKQLAQIAVESFVPGASQVRTVEAGANAVGAQGVADAANDFTKTTGQVGDGIIDQASGDAKKKAEEATRNEAAAGAAADAAAAEEKKRLMGAEAASRESARMAAGSKSRTLLTGPAGLEDENGKKSVSRRTLAAR
jgi:hypothetical protein